MRKGVVSRSKVQESVDAVERGDAIIFISVRERSATSEWKS